MRTLRGFTHRQMAEQLCMNTSNYTRRETGKTKINGEEWEKLAKILEVPFSEIYEPDEGHVLICNDNASGNFITNNGTNSVHPVSESILATFEKYIKKLEEENALLKLQIEK